MSKILITYAILFFIAFNAFSQTPGIIYKPAGTGASVLDPNGDGYSSATTSGFTSNDQTESEIPYRALVVPALEPTADPGPGPDCGFTDIVDSGAEDPVFTFLDAQSNLLFRFRLGSSANNSKGYSILIDTDQRFGFTGSHADPNAVSGNPGFEIEIVLRTNFGVSLYDVDGTINPSLKTTLAYDNYAQKSVALTTNCGNADYFYDFFIPFSTITSSFPSITPSTPVRMVAVTSMSPAAAIGNSAVSDVGGIDDEANGYSLDNIFQIIIDNFYPTSVTDISSGTILDRSATPTVTGPISAGATALSGTSTEIGATIKVFTGSTEPYSQIGTATVSSNGSWTVNVTALSVGDVVQATATNINEGESYYSSSVTVTNCATPAAPYNLVREANRKYISGTGTPGATIKVYLFSAGSYVQQSGSFILDPTGTGSFCWVPGVSVNSCTPPKGAGALTNGTTYYISQTIGGCESSKAPLCVDNQVSNSPTLSQTTLYTTTTTLSGTSGNGAAITIYANGVSIATVTAIGTSWSATVNLTSHAGKYISVGAIDGSKCMAIALSSSVLVQSVQATSATPAITGTYCATTLGTSVSISGTSIEADGAIVTVYLNNVSGGTTTVFNGTWFKFLIVKGGDILTATVTGSGKNVSATSNSVTVNVSGDAPAVTFDTPILEGASSFSGTFSGSGTLKIYIDGYLLGSTTNSPFTISGLTAFDLYAGGVLKATINSGGCESAMSAGATVDCLLPSSSLSVSPASSFICAGSTTDVTILQSESGVIYQLFNDGSATSASKLGTGEDITLTTQPLTTDATITVKALKISPIACTITLSNSQNVNITQPITGNSISAPSIDAFCQSGDPDPVIGAMPGGGNGTFTYQWQSSPDDISYSDIIGATDKNYDPGELSQTTYLRRIVYSGTCQSITSSPVIITIENTVITNSISNSIPSHFIDSGAPSIDGNDAGSGITYQWQSSVDNISFNNTGVSTEDYSSGAIITEATYFRRLASNGSCTVVSNTIAWTVNHSPVITNFSKSGWEDNDINFSSADFTDVYSDVDGQPLTQIIIEAVSSDGTLRVNGNTLGIGSIVALDDLASMVFIPNADYNGPASFSWKGFDGEVYSNAANVELVIGSVNDAPHFVNGANQNYRPTDGSVTVNAWTSDISAGAFNEAAQSLDFIVTNDNPALFSVQPAIDATTGDLTFTVDSEALGSANVSVTLTDNGGTANGGVDVSNAQSFVITISNTANVPPVISNGGATISINEASPSGTVVFTLLATDPNDDVINYSIVSGNTSGAFTMHSATGVISVWDASQLDFEAIQQFILIVSASDGANDDQTTITINLNNLNDNAPVVNSTATVSLDENSANGTRVYTVSASDTDGDELTYTIRSGNTSSTFAINSTTGEITISDASQLDFEATPQFVLVVTVSDGTHETQTTITINLNNLNDNAPVVNSSTTVSLDENSANGVSVHTISASDVDGNALMYSITSGNESGAFVINATTGIMSVANAAELDFEKTPSFAFTIGISDGSHQVYSIITINLNNLNDNNPKVNSDAIVSLDENSATGTTLFEVVASDKDGDNLKYTIVSGNESNAFTINRTTGKITVADGAKLDFEKTQQFVLMVAVSDGDTRSYTTVTINLNDLNDNSPVVGVDATVKLDENSASETIVYAVAASDSDGNPLSYSIVSGNEGAAFTIDSSTGIISVSSSSALDFESVSQFILTIEVTDGIHKIQTFVTVLLNNLNDNAPVVSPEASISLDENSSFGATVYTVTASDADSNSLSYNIDSGNELGAFSIDSKTGIITISNADVLDYEITQKFVLTVLVSDGSNIKTIQIIINLSDLPDTAIITKPSPLTSTITAAATSMLADGISSTLITVQLKDANGVNFNIDGDTVIVLTTNGTLSNVIDLGNGTYQATLTSSTTAGIALLTATLNSAVMIDTEEVSFTEVLIPIYTMTITADELSIPADGSSSATITITIVDQNGKVAAGLDVQAITTSGSLGNVTENEDGTYSVVLTSSTTATEATITVSVDGIAESKTIKVRFSSVESEDFFIPEGFSPDGDGVNDVFVIRGAESLTISLKVYDRWGDLVYEKLPYKNDWDGSSNHGKLQDGTYYYVVHVINSLRQYVRYFTIKRK